METELRRLVIHAAKEHTRGSLVRAGACGWAVRRLEASAEDPGCCTDRSRLDVLRLLRNLCACGDEAKLEMMRFGMVEGLMCLTYRRKETMKKILLQLLCNFTIQFHPGQEAVWASWFPEHLVDVIEGSKDAKTAVLIARICLNCVEDNDDRRNELASSPTGRELVASLLRVMKFLSLDDRELHIVEKLIGSLLHRPDFFVETFCRVEDMHGKAKLTEHFYHCFSERENHGKLLTDRLAVLLCEGLDTAVSNTTSQQDSIEHLADPEYITGSSALVYQLLKLLRVVTQIEGQQEGTSLHEDFVQQLWQSGMLELLTRILGSLGIPRPFKAQGRGHQNGKDKQGGLVNNNQSQLLYRGYRTDVIAVLTNMSFRRSYCQNELLSLGGVDLVLSNCQVEMENPLLREWSLLCVRNLCEENEAIRNHIASLQLIDAEHHPELEELGLRVELDQDGKPQVRHIDVETGLPLPQRNWTSM